MELPASGWTKKKNMQIESKDKAIELLYRALPYANQIVDLDTTSDTGGIYFTWRSARYKITLHTGGVEEARDRILAGTDTAMLIKELLKREQIAQL